MCNNVSVAHRITKSADSMLSKIVQTKGMSILRKDYLGVVTLVKRLLIVAPKRRLKLKDRKERRVHARLWEPDGQRHRSY